MVSTPDEVYGRAWRDHSKWLLQQGNSHRAGPDRERLYAQSRAAAEVGLNADGWHLPAPLLPFETGFTMGPSPDDDDTLPGVPQHTGGWVCRYCNRGEGTYVGTQLPLSARAERGRAFTHEAMCPHRPADNPVTPAERRVMGEYLRQWMRPRLDMVDEQIRMLSPRPGYQHTVDQNRQLADWHARRADLLLILTRCGVDDEQLAALPPERQQTREEFLAEIAAMSAAAGGGR